MKTPFDPRHQKRREAVQALFAWGFKDGKIENALAAQVVSKLNKIDNIIGKCASEWPIEQINRLDLAVLRLAIFEMTIAKKEPPKVIIDEAVELAKEFGGESSPSFVNGVLGAVLRG
ncbi:MAG: transcription antitermination factor NusB [Patescibacteria group bacterium]